MTLAHDDPGVMNLRRVKKDAGLCRRRSLLAAAPGSVPALALILSVALSLALSLAGATRARAELPQLSSGQRMEIHGFTDFNFFADDRKGDGPQSGFQEGQFVLHFNAPLSQRTVFFAEITWTPHSEAFGTEVERTIFKYTQSDQLKISFGRYHTPINWWNTAYHHGIWLQTTVARPEWVKFGGDFLPIHFVGGLMEGTVAAGGLNLLYQAGLGNGRSETISRANDAGDVNNHRAWLANLCLQADRVYALRVGGSVYQDRFPVEAGPVVDETIGSGYVIWERETPQLMAEYAHVWHKDVATGAESKNWAYYVLLAYRLPIWGQRWKPYARGEEMDVAASDPAFGGLIQDYRRYLGGVRIDVADQAALKLEYQRIREGGEDYYNAVYSQISVAF
jgi:hypothetical protein